MAVGVLVEGPVVTVVAGSLAGAGLLAWQAVWLTAVLADVASDSVLYALGRAGEQPRVRPLLARLGLTDERRDLLREKIDGNLGGVVVAAKFVDVGAVPAFLAIGLSGVPYRRLLRWVVPTAVVRVALLLGLGWLAGAHVADALATRRWLVVVAGVAVAVVLLGTRALWVRLAARKEVRWVS